MTIKVKIQRRRNASALLSKRIKGFNSLLNLFFIAPMKAQRRIDLDAARLDKMQQDRKIGELEEGIKSNKLVLLDIQIEAKKLELMALKRKLGDPEAFAPEMTGR